MIDSFAGWLGQASNQSRFEEAQRRAMKAAWLFIAEAKTETKRGRTINP